MGNRIIHVLSYVVVGFVAGCWCTWSAVVRLMVIGGGGSKRWLENVPVVSCVWACVIVWVCLGGYVTVVVGFSPTFCAFCTFRVPSFMGTLPYSLFAWWGYHVEVCPWVGVCARGILCPAMVTLLLSRGLVPRECAQSSVCL